MIFKTLIFTISLLIGQGSQDIFLINSDIALEIVDDSGRKKEIKKLSKSYSEVQNELNALLDNQANEFAASIQKRESRSYDLRKILEEQRYDRLNFFSEMIEYRLDFQKILSSDEWNTYLNEVYKKPVRPESSEIGTALGRTEVLSNLGSAINKTFEGSKYASKAQEHFKVLVESLGEITLNEADRKFSSGQILSMKSASQRQLQKVVEDQFVLQSAVADAIIRFRTEMLKITEPEDWEMISSELSNLTL